MDYFDNLNIDTQQNDSFDFISRECMSSNNQGPKNMNLVKKGGKTNKENISPNTVQVNNLKKNLILCFNNDEDIEEENVFGENTNNLHNSSQRSDESNYLFPSSQLNHNPSNPSNTNNTNNINNPSNTNNPSNPSNAYNNKKRNSNDIMRDMKEMENLFSGKKPHAQMPQMPQMPQGQTKKTNQNFQPITNYNNKKNRLETSIPESNEEEEGFDCEGNLTANIPSNFYLNNNNQETKGNITKSVSFVNNRDTENIKPNVMPKNNAITTNKKIHLGNIPISEAIVVEKTMMNAGNKKITLYETNDEKDAILEDYLYKYNEMNRQVAEKKESVKKIMNLAKLYEKLYLKMEDFKNKLPNYVERYLESYQRELEECNRVMEQDDQEIDQILDENDAMMEIIKEKLKFN